MNGTPIIRCRLCRDAAIGIYHMPKGCACAPDPVQALCAQHLITAEPIAGLWAVIEGGWYAGALPRQAIRDVVQTSYPEVSGDILDEGLSRAWAAYAQRGR